MLLARASAQRDTVPPPWRGCFMKLPLLLALAAACLSGPSAAQDFPNKPIRVVVPFTPGSATDIIARFVTPKMAERWGRPVVIDNRPSAGGIVACQAVAESIPDGHTLMVT